MDTNATLDPVLAGQGDTLDLRELTRLLWMRRWWLISCVVIMAALVTTLAFMMTPVYRATSILIPAGTASSGLGASLGGQLGSLGGLAALAGVNIGGESDPTEEALAVLRSRQFTEAFIREQNLMPVLYANRWDATARAWKGEPAEAPTYAQAYRRFNREIRIVFQDKKSGLVTLQIDWKDRKLAADWANALIARLNQEMRRRAIEHADASLKFLQQELNTTSVVDTRLAINRLVEGQINTRMLANVTGEYAFRVVDPAMVPDVRDVVRPRKMLMIVLSVIAGGVLGVLLILLFGRPAVRQPS